MVFSSLQFIFLFLPIFLVIYLLLPAPRKNLFLLMGSILFYGYGVRSNPSYILLILFSVLINFWLAKKIGTSLYRYRDSLAKFYLNIGIVYNVGILFLFKYAHFFMVQISRVFPVPEQIQALPVFHLELPIGISFYTFQAMSYLVDVYRGTSLYDRSLIDFGAYLTMFPQLIAGPIVTYQSVRKYIKENRTVNLSSISKGTKLFIFGLGMKVVLANQLGSLWTTLGNIGFDSISTPLAWMGIVARSFQIYFDFFGYSIMAIGLGQMLGIPFPRNFDHPYLAKSMTDFWRRWHITLGSWFREYVYIPLGGNRRGSLITYRNLLVVWVLTGLWHGASWNFLFWGLSLFFLIAVEKAFLYRFLNRHGVMAFVYMFFAVNLTWAMFSIPDWGKLLVFYGRLFPFFGQGEAIFPGDYIKYGKEYWHFFLLGVLFSTRIPYRMFTRGKDSWQGQFALLATYGAALYSLYRGLNDPFLYFRF